MSPRKAKAQPPITVGAKTDVGQVRAQNEDSMLVKLPLLVVADGIGGQEAGEIASQIAIETMEIEAPVSADAEQLGDAVVHANAAVMRAAEEGRGRPGMGTTMTAAYIEHSTLAVAQVGDSRAYRIRAGEIEQLTHDHSLIAAMVDSGQITEEEARTHPSRSIITRALGSDPDMRPDLFEFDLRDGDRIILCSDGLHGMIPDDHIKLIMDEYPDAQEAADALVAAANAAGGMDNVTVIVANVDKVSPAEEVKMKRSRRFSAIIFAVVAAVLVVAAIGGFTFFINSSAYLIAEDGVVAVYKGRLDNSSGLGKSELQYASDVKVDKLPDITQEKLAEGVQFGSLEEAEETLESYRVQIQVDEKSAEEAKKKEAAAKKEVEAKEAERAAKLAAMEAEYYGYDEEYYYDEDEG
ncbi:MAG: Stp1/IreP family PP2C-type Ser/Thr phosphatase [Coriobacteriales bacterium]|jgi:serine/threonine protein phosphatase PrpC